MEAADREKQECARCGAPFVCGALSGDKTCWCFAFSPLPPDRVNAGHACVRAQCLNAELQGTPASS